MTTRLSTLLNGVDSAGAIAGRDLQKSGTRFVARYPSNFPWKNLTAAEAHDLTTHGIPWVTVWEDGAAGAYLGYHVGRSHAEPHVTMAQGAWVAIGSPGG
jgi:hypothetical protein